MDFVFTTTHTNYFITDTCVLILIVKFYVFPKNANLFHFYLTLLIFVYIQLFLRRYTIYSKLSNSFMKPLYFAVNLHSRNSITCNTIFNNFLN